MKDSLDGQETFEVVNPAGGIAGLAPDMSDTDLDAAVARAQTAFYDWSSTEDQTRRDICSAIAAEIEAHSEELAQLLTAEQGKPLNGMGSRWEVGAAQAWAGYTASLSLDPKVIQDGPEGTVMLHRRPLGVVGSITPWNFPLMIAVWHLLPALRSGNTVVIKPSPYTPLTTLRFVEILKGLLPSGVVEIVTSRDIGRASDETLGARMAVHPGIAKIVFTGSCATGREVMRSAAGTMKRLTLELGGNDAGIVLPDVDPQGIAEALFWSIFVNSGQTCASLKRLYVHADVHDEVIDALVRVAKQIPAGPGSEEESLLGPVQNTAQHAHVSRLVSEAIAAGGNVHFGGRPGEGLFFQPTIISGLSDSASLVTEEQFAPAVPVLSFTDIDDAVVRANSTETGLGGSVWSADVNRAANIAGRLECGSVWVNKHGAIQPNVPFGGRKMSGLGVEFGQEGLDAYTDIQTIFT